MKLTKQEIKHLIQEELRDILQEDSALFASKIDSLMKSGFDGICKCKEDVPKLIRIYVDKYVNDFMQENLKFVVQE